MGTGRLSRPAFRLHRPIASIASGPPERMPPLPPCPSGSIGARATRVLAPWVPRAPAVVPPGRSRRAASRRSRPAASRPPTRCEARGGVLRGRTCRRGRESPATMLRSGRPEPFDTVRLGDGSARPMLRRCGPVVSASMLRGSTSRRGRYRVRSSRLRLFRVSAARASVTFPAMVVGHGVFENSVCRARNQRPHESPEARGWSICVSLPLGHSASELERASQSMIENKVMSI
jgi:hypothetical protein